MIPDALNMLARPDLDRPRMILGFTGWMDGGDVSTGTVNTLLSKLDAEVLADIRPEEFYIYGSPGSMETSALFRPHAAISEGLLQAYQPPVSRFYSCPDDRLILFEGREPNLHWPEYAECILTVAEEFGTEAIYFVGSVAGVVPHTRDPRLFASVSRPELHEQIERIGARPSDYEGPASFVTHLTHVAGEREIDLYSLVAEIPAYIRGTNPRCIEAMVRRLAAILGIQIENADLRAASDAFERKINQLATKREELG